MKDIYLIGGGGHCRSCIDVIESMGTFKIKGIFDTQLEKGKSILGYKVLGDDESISNICPSGFSAIVTIGQIKNSESRLMIYKKLLSLGANLETIISKKAYVSSHASIGSGSIVMHGAIVNASAKIKENCIINSKALVEHDAIIEAHTHISTGSNVNGGVTIGERVFIGSNSTVKNNIKIGHQSIIGAGQIVLDDLPPFSMIK